MNAATSIRIDDVLCIGDVVTWTHVLQRGPSVQFSTRRAKVLNIGKNNVAVKYRGKLINLRPDRIRKDGERTELTDMVMSTLNE